MKTKALDKTSSQELDKAVFEAFTAFANRSDEISRSGRAKLITDDEGKRTIVKEGSTGWTQHDTEMCEMAEASGIAVWKKTGKPITWDELKKFANEVDRIRSAKGEEAADAFHEEHIGSIPFVETKF